MLPKHGHQHAAHGSLTRSLGGSSLVRFGVFTLTLFAALFWARQKLISPTPKMAVADPQVVTAAPEAQGGLAVDTSER